MSDRTSAAIFGEIFGVLADELPAGEKRDALAKRFWLMSQDYDFNEYQMECDEVLLELGLAHMSGTEVIYEPPYSPSGGKDGDE